MYEATSENIDISWTDSPMGPPENDDLATLVGVTVLALAIIILIIL